MHVNGKFTYSNNTVTSWSGDPVSFSQSMVSGLHADGGQFVS
jgi:V8-like Glu-specific endopeptidase